MMLLITRIYAGVVASLFRTDTQQSHYSGFGCQLPCETYTRPSSLPHAF